MLIGNLAETLDVNDRDFLIISKDNVHLLKIKRENFLKGVSREGSGGGSGKVLYGTEPPGDLQAANGTLYVLIDVLGEKYMETDSTSLEHDSPAFNFTPVTSGSTMWYCDNPFYKSLFDDTPNSLSELPKDFIYRDAVPSPTRTFNDNLIVVDKGIPAIRNYHISFTIETDDYWYLYDNTPAYLTIGRGPDDEDAYSLPMDLSPGLYELDNFPECYFIQLPRTKNTALDISFDFVANEHNTQWTEAEQIENNMAKIFFKLYFEYNAGTGQGGHGADLHNCKFAIKNFNVTPSSDFAYGNIRKIFIKTPQGWISTDELSGNGSDVIYRSLVSSTNTRVGILHTKNKDFNIYVPSGNTEVVYTEQGTHSSPEFDRQGKITINGTDYYVYLPHVQANSSIGTQIAEIGGVPIYNGVQGGGGSDSSRTRVYKNTNTSQISSITFTETLKNGDWDELVVYIRNMDAASSAMQKYAPIRIINSDWYDDFLGELAFVYSLPSDVNAAKSISVSLRSTAGDQQGRYVTGLSVNTWPGSSSFIYSVYAIKY